MSRGDLRPVALAVVGAGGPRRVDAAREHQVEVDARAPDVVATVNVGRADRLENTVFRSAAEHPPEWARGREPALSPARRPWGALEDDAPDVGLERRRRAGRLVRAQARYQAPPSLLFEVVHRASHGTAGIIERGRARVSATRGPAGTATFHSGKLLRAYRGVHIAPSYLRVQRARRLSPGGSEPPTATALFHPFAAASIPRASLPRPRWLGCLRVRRRRPRRSRAMLHGLWMAPPSSLGRPARHAAISTSSASGRAAPALTRRPPSPTPSAAVGTVSSASPRLRHSSHAAPDSVQVPAGRRGGAGRRRGGARGGLAPLSCGPAPAAVGWTLLALALGVPAPSSPSRLSVTRDDHGSSPCSLLPSLRPRPP